MKRVQTSHDGQQSDGCSKAKRAVQSENRVFNFDWKDSYFFVNTNDKAMYLYAEIPCLGLKFAT